MRWRTDGRSGRRAAVWMTVDLKIRHRNETLSRTDEHGRSGKGGGGLRAGRRRGGRTIWSGTEMVIWCDRYGHLVLYLLGEIVVTEIVVVELVVVEMIWGRIIDLSLRRPVYESVQLYWLATSFSTRLGLPKYEIRVIMQYFPDPSILWSIFIPGNPPPPLTPNHVIPSTTLVSCLIIRNPSLPGRYAPETECNRAQIRLVVSPSLSRAYGSVRFVIHLVHTFSCVRVGTFRHSLGTHVRLYSTINRHLLDNKITINAQLMRLQMLSHYSRTGNNMADCYI